MRPGPACPTVRALKAMFTKALHIHTHTHTHIHTVSFVHQTLFLARVGRISGQGSIVTRVHAHMLLMLTLTNTECTYTVAEANSLKFNFTVYRRLILRCMLFKSTYNGRHNHVYSMTDYVHTCNRFILVLVYDFTTKNEKVRLRIREFL